MRIQSPPPSPNPRSGGIKPALLHIGKEMSQEAIVGITYASMVSVGEAVGHPLLGRAAVLALGGFRGYGEYRESASAALQSKLAGAGLAVALGASQAALTGFSGNLMVGAGIGALMGLARSPKTYPGS